ncbi:MAG: hypothetical protein H0U62_10375 [Actinobacteria bacterium]|nr:hypothetical protein [Actinomycetota bacterium]
MTNVKNMGDPGVDELDGLRGGRLVVAGEVASDSEELSDEVDVSLGISRGVM